MLNCFQCLTFVKLSFCFCTTLRPFVKKKSLKKVVFHERAKNLKVFQFVSFNLSGKVFNIVISLDLKQIESLKVG